MTIGNVRTGSRRVLFLIATALVMWLHAPVHVLAGNNDVSASIAVTPGDHDLRIPPIPDGSEMATITVTITAAPGWRLVRLDPAPAGWFGTYQRLYDGMSPGVAYEAVFSGELEPITSGGGGEADYTFTVNAEGTSGKPDFRVRPDEQVVCVGKSAAFIAEKRLNDQSPWEPKISNWTFNSTEQPPAASSKTFSTDDPGRYTVTAEANGLSGSATLTVVKVDITGFSVPYTYACAPECPTINHQATCYATIEPLGVATITYSPQGDAHGAFIDASTGVITPSTTKSGEITVRATASILPECYAESTFVIRARPTNVSQSTVSRLAVPVGGEWIHTFNGTGGSLSETEVVETITEINWPFRRVELETGGSTTLDENGTMEGADKIWEPGWNFDINDFLPSPPKAGLPQDGTHAQEWDWCCPMCYGARRDIEQGVENITFTLFEDALSPTGYSVKITTGYGATGEPIEFVYAGEPLL